MLINCTSYPPAVNVKKANKMVNKTKKTTKLSTSYTHFVDNFYVNRVENEKK